MESRLGSLSYVGNESHWVEVVLDEGRGKDLGLRKDPVKIATPEATRFAEHLTRIVKKHWDYDYAQAPRFIVHPGEKYDKIVKIEVDKEGREVTTGRSVHAFVDSEARVYKAESWSRPCKKPKYDDTVDALRAFKNSPGDRRIGNIGYLYASYKPAVKD